MPGIRRRSRTTALQLLYQQEINPVPPEQAMASFLEEEKVPEKAREFALRLVETTLAQQETIDRQLTAALEHWKMSRLPAVVRNLLRMAVAEMLVLEEAPVQVVINEAVEMARQYMDEESAKFVNGVLEKCWINDGRELPHPPSVTDQALSGLSPAAPVDPAPAENGEDSEEKGLPGADSKSDNS